MQPRVEGARLSTRWNSCSRWHRERARGVTRRPDAVGIQRPLRYCQGRKAGEGVSLAHPVQTPDQRTGVRPRRWQAIVAAGGVSGPSSAIWPTSSLAGAFPSIVAPPGRVGHWTAPPTTDGISSPARRKRLKNRRSATVWKTSRRAVGRFVEFGRGANRPTYRRIRRLLPKMSAVTTRRASLELAEDAIEVRQAVESTGKADAGNITISRFQEPAGCADPTRLHESCEGHSRRPVEHEREMCSREASRACNVPPTRDAG